VQQQQRLFARALVLFALKRNNNHSKNKERYENMSLLCELSGEPITIGSSDNSSSMVVVVTPSGHVCRKSLLLQKLRDNGGIDPFDDHRHDEKRPLTEDDLIVVHQFQPSSSNDGRGGGTSTMIVPPPPPRTYMNHSMSVTIQQIQNEYDALLLELYDTKKALQQTQQELSLSLYQNDAAVRVVARVTAERDVALQTLQQAAAVNGFNDSNNNGHASVSTITANVTDTQEEPQVKKRKLTTNTDTDNDDDKTSSHDATTTSTHTDSTKLVLNQLPDYDSTVMVQTWEQLHETRRARQKAALALATQLKFSSSPKQPSIVLAPSTTNDTIVPSLTTTPSSSSSLKTYRTSSDPTRESDTLLQVNHNTCTLYVKTKKDTQEQASYVTTSFDTVLVNDDTTTNSSSVSRNGRRQCFDTIPSSKENDKSIVALVIQNDTTNTTSMVLYENQQLLGECLVPKNNNESTVVVVVNVQLHPDRQHIIMATQCGVIYIGRYDQNNNDTVSTNQEHTTTTEKTTTTVSMIAQFTCPPSIVEEYNNEANAGRVIDDSTRMIYNAGTLHPDGLIYVTAVTMTGNLLLWDFKSQQLAGTLINPLYDNQNKLDEQQQQTKLYTVTSMEFSNNGYHLAVAYKESGIIHIWDIRKQTILATMNQDHMKLEQVRSVKFDDSGKYLAYSGCIGDDLMVEITTVKKWDRTASFRVPNVHARQGLIWSKDLQFIAVSAVTTTTNNDKKESQPQVVFFDL
jgi:Prp19/Pso4-like